MRALVSSAGSPSGLQWREVPDPTPGPSQALVEVRAVSLNYLDVAYRAERVAEGAVPGVDASGVVVARAADDSGPPVGTAVAGFAGGGAWAQRRAVETSDLAEVPAGVDVHEAAALPAAGVTAVQAVRRLGPLLGRRVLVTGASGGVGRYAVQLSHLAGAEVVAAVGGPGRGEGLPELGAREVVWDVAGAGAVDAVLDNVGGPLLSDALDLLSPGGVCLSIGQASRLPTTIDLERHRVRGGTWRLEPFVVRGPFGPDLEHLLGLVAADRLDLQVGWRGGWEQIEDAVELLRSRKLRGKAVLVVS